MNKKALSPKEKYLQFRIDMLNAKHKGQHTETWIVECMLELYKEGNPYLKHALEEGIRFFSPRSNIINSFWKKAETVGFTQDVGGAADKGKILRCMRKYR